MKRINKFLFNLLILLILIFSSQISYSKILKFENIEEARKIYPNNNAKAKSLLLETIEYYKNKKPKYPWNAYAYSTLSEFYQKEGDLKESLKYQIEACKEFKTFFSKKKKEKYYKRDEPLSSCFFTLSYLYKDNAQLNEALEVNLINIKIHEKYDNYIINPKSKRRTFPQILFQSASIYKDFQDYKKESKSYERYILVLKKYNLESKINYYEALKYLSSSYDLQGNSTKSKEYIFSALENLEKFHPTLNLEKAGLLSTIAVKYINSDPEKSIKYYVLAKKELNRSKFENLKKNSEQYKSYIDNYFSITSGYVTAKYNLTKDISFVKKTSKEMQTFNNSLDLLDQSIDGYEKLESLYTSIDQNNLALDLNTKSLNLINKKIKAVEISKLRFKDIKLKSLKNSKKNIIFDRAYIMIDLGDYEKAYNLADQLKPYLAINKNKYDLLFRVNFTNLEGRLYQDQGQYAEAIKKYLLALKILKIIPGNNEVYKETIFNNLALSYSNSGQQNEAEKTFKVLLKYKNNNYSYSDINLLNNFAYTTSDPDTLCSLSEIAINIYKNLSEEFRRTENYIFSIMNYGNCYIIKKDYQRALEIYDMGINFVKSKLGDKEFGFNQYLISYANLMYSLKKTDDSIFYLTAAVDDLHNKYGMDTPRLIRPYKSLSSSYGLQKNDKEQIFYGIKALDLILKEIDKRNLSLDFNLSNYILKHRLFLENLMFSIIRVSNESPATLNEYKNRDFLDLIFLIQQILKINKLNLTIQQAVAIDLSNDAKSSDKIKKLTRLMSDRDKLLLSSPVQKNKNNYEKIKLLDLKIKKQNEDIKKNYPDYKKNYASQFAPTAAVGAMLAPDEVYIELTHSKFFTYITALTKEKRIIQFSKIKKDDLIESIKKVRQSVQLKNNKIVPFDYQNSYKIYSKILAPVKDAFKDKKKIIIVPDGPSLSLPFEILINNQLSKKYLIEDYMISTMPSVGTFLGIDKSQKYIKEKSFVGFGNPKIQKVSKLDNLDIKEYSKDFSQFYTRGGKVKIDYLRLLPELPETETELNLIAKNFKGKSTIITGRNFSENSVKNFDFKNSKIINFASHALVVGEIQGLAEPAILTSIPDTVTDNDDGLLKSSEIALLKISSDLIVLSACNTASSDGNPNSHGFSGLVNSFFYAGAKSLLVTHWSVISDTSVKLVDEIFKFINLTDGNLALSLQKAKINMIKSKDMSHPIYWGAYVLVGRSSI